jgi:hypothetical protein
METYDKTIFDSDDDMATMQALSLAEELQKV